MTRLKTLAAALAASTLLAGAAVAADQAAQSTPAAQQAHAVPLSPQQRQADADAGKLSTDGADAYRDVHLARLAIFEAEPEQARMFVSHAQSALDKAKTDTAAFTKAEADLKPPAGMAAATLMGQGAKGQTAPGQQGAAKAADSTAPSTQPVAWLPVDAQLVLADDFVARNPDQSKAIEEANQHLQKGDRQGAVDRLKLAGVDVDFTMAVVPLAKTTQGVDQAAKLIAGGQYYQANVALKQVEDAVRFDVIDARAVPTTASAAKSDTAKSGAAKSGAAKSDTAGTNVSSATGSKAAPTAR
jgi:hypothetical protein